METAVKGGSISIFRDKKLLDFHIGDKSVSGSEYLLLKIAELLDKNNISKSEIHLIIISNGPGSFTGIRIGIATALALAKSLKCKCYGVDLLKKLAQKGSIQTGAQNIIVAVSQGRNKICWSNFEIQKLNSIDSENKYIVSDLNFLVKQIAKKSESAQSAKMITVCADSDIFDALGKNKEIDFQDEISLISVGENLSGILGFALPGKETNFEKPQPLYLSETNFIT